MFKACLKSQQKQPRHKIAVIAIHQGQWPSNQEVEETNGGEF